MECLSRCCLDVRKCVHKRTCILDNCPSNLFSAASVLSVISTSVLFLLLQPPCQQRPRRHNRSVPLRPSRNHPDLHLQKIRNKSQILDRRPRQLRPVLHAVGSFIPTRQRLVFRSNVLVLFRERRHFPQWRALVLVPHAHLNFSLRIKNVQLG